MSVKELQVESHLHLSISSFVNDLTRVVDEILSERDIIKKWHINDKIASKVFSTLSEVLFGEEFSDSSGSSEEEPEDDDEDEFDNEASDSSECDSDSSILVDIYEDI